MSEAKKIALLEGSDGLSAALALMLIGGLVEEPAKQEAAEPEPEQPKAPFIYQTDIDERRLAAAVAKRERKAARARELEARND